MRHRFCSYWLALHQDNNPDIMWRHYHKGTKRSEAEKFWAINLTDDTQCCRF
jgi:hypothetical protein